MNVEAQPTGGRADRDPLFQEAAEVCIQHRFGSTSLLQRKLRIGYGRAARLIDQLHEAGLLGAPSGSKPREVLLRDSEGHAYTLPRDEPIPTVRVVLPQLEWLLAVVGGAVLVYVIAKVFGL